MRVGMQKESLFSEIHKTEEFWHRSTRRLTDFKTLVEAADREALRNDGQVSGELFGELSSTLQALFA